MPGEGRAGHQWRGKGAREGGTKARRRGRGSDGGEECGAGWRGRGGREDATRRRAGESALGAGEIVGQAGELPREMTLEIKVRGTRGRKMESQRSKCYQALSHLELFRVGNLWLKPMAGGQCHLGAITTSGLVALESLSTEEEMASVTAEDIL